MSEESKELTLKEKLENNVKQYEYQLSVIKSKIYDAEKELNGLNESKDQLNGALQISEAILQNLTEEKTEE